MKHKKGYETSEGIKRIIIIIIWIIILALAYYGIKRFFSSMIG